MPRATFYRENEERARSIVRVGPRPSPRRLSEEERRAVLEVLHCERFADKAPAVVRAMLLDEDRYLCSERTMYRILAANDEVRERRNLLRHPPAPKPQLVATAPNQVWSWDITKLLGPYRGILFRLYVVLDIFSRYVVGWMLAHQESAELAERLLREAIEREGIDPGQLTVHADRGPAMISQGVAELLAALGLAKSHGRPHVSNDNPYSESQFKTAKYQPGFPDRFGSYEHPLAFCQRLFPWYNHEHRHSGIAYLTPADVHHGRAHAALEDRRRVLEAAYQVPTPRFVHGVPQPGRLPQEVWINPPSKPGGREEDAP